MDATTQLALMTKAKLVFETQGTFLSFPVLTPISYDPAHLDFSRAPTDPATAAAQLDFTRAVNRCLTGPVDNAESATCLWDSYDGWLSAMELAHSDLSAQDQTDDAAALALLVVVDANNRTSDSDIVITYKKCRDAVLNAEQAYKAAEVTALAPATPQAQAAWQAGDEPALRAAIATANTNWETTGRKADVEAAQATLARCQARMPQAMWAAWRNGYDPTLDNVTDPVSNATYAPSGFSPSDLVVQDWATLHLTAAEIASLSATAPAALRTLFGDTPPTTTTAMSFEFRSAAVTRQWFAPAMFASRFWKFSDATVLSDGAAPPAGTWPCMVNAVVFVRNIQMTTSAAAQSPQPVSALPRPTLPPEVWHRLGAPASLAGEIPQRGFVGGRPMLPQAMAMLAPRPLPARPPVLVTPTHPPVLIPVRPPVPAPPPSPPPASTAPKDDRISILAFICQPLAAAPHPDPALAW